MTRDELLKRISIEPDVCFGKPCIRGHRIWVSLVLDLLASGWSFQQVVDNYPGIAEDDIRACIAYGAETSRERHVDLPAPTSIETKEFEELRSALAELALPATRQMSLFQGADSAVNALKEQFGRAYGQLDISRNVSLSSVCRQQLDELFYIFLSDHCFVCEPNVKPWTDEFLRESEFWGDIRQQAELAISLLDGKFVPMAVCPDDPVRINESSVAQELSDFFRDEPDRVSEPRTSQEFSTMLTRVAEDRRPLIVLRDSKDLVAVIPLEQLELLCEHLQIGWGGTPKTPLPGTSWPENDDSLPF